MRGLVLIEISSKYFATAFHIVFFPKLDNLKKHLLRFGILELAVLRIPALRKAFFRYVPFLNDNANRYRQTNEFT